MESDTRRIKVMCTDRGQHAEVTLHRLSIHADHIDYLRFKEKRGPWGRNSSTPSGTSVTNAAIVPVDSPREDYQGRERWRFVCGRCRRDVVVTGDRLRRIAENGVSSVDISLIP